MEGVMHRINGAVVYLNDNLVMGRMDGGHLSTLEKVVDCLQLTVLQLKQSKCSFMVPFRCVFGAQGGC